MNTLLLFLLYQSSSSLRNVSLDGPDILFLGLTKRYYRGWLSMMTSLRGPLFQPCLGFPPNLSPPLALSPERFLVHACLLIKYV